MSEAEKVNESPSAKHFPLIGMMPTVWGPILWTSMHIVTMGYSPVPTEQEKQGAINYFESLAYMIPCPICRIHYKEHLKKHPVKEAVSSRNDLIMWVFNVHNEVNKQLEKPVITIEQFIKNLTILSNLESFQIYKPAENKHTLPLMLGIGVLLGVGIGAAGLYYYKKNT